MKIIINRVILEEDLNNDGYNYWADENNSIKFSDNIYKQFENQKVIISHATDNDKITIEN